ncbi:hypothetical protein [Pseudoalteromonas sp. T1lg88]|uniref:hypothetical protein n=1 Tax=Pseudoalteromonas sp. T1lg88 TaxID=2077104 RepID=UPI000CF5F8A5|nr:hypothetical protein [Pseudoalteromonas sp. T1lg88]
MKNFKKKYVTVTFSFLFQSDRFARGGFRYIHQRNNPSECYMKEVENGKVVLQVTRLVRNKDEDIFQERAELESDMKYYGGKFLNQKYRFISSNGNLSNKKISKTSKLLTMLTPPGDARNYIKQKVPFYSLVLVFALYIFVLWVK